MNIRSVASQFTVYVYSRDLDSGAGAKVSLAHAGYDAYFFEDTDALEARVAEKAPHIVVFPTLALTMGLSDFIEKILKMNGEIRFVLIAHPSQFETLASYNDYGLVDIVGDDTLALPERVLWAVDRACEKLYLTYQNEQLLEKLNQQPTDARPDAGPVAGSDAASAPVFSVLDRVSDYATANSKEELIQKFFEVTGVEKALFLKFLPTVSSFVVTNAAGIPSENFQGVGCKLEGPEAKDLATQIALGVVPPTLGKLMKDAFQLDPVRLRPLLAHGQLEGLVVTEFLATHVEAKFVEDFALFSIYFGLRGLEKRVEALEVTDTVTGVYNKQFYTARLTEEISRARRIQQPLSVVKLALDDFFELEASLGEAARDQILKNLADVIMKTSRTNDFTCRSGQNEFALILPHAPRQGAMIRAERLRRIVAGTQMLDNGLKISISLGISEYPTLCRTADQLDESSTKALTHIQDKGGNKLCLSKAPVDHKPDFVVPEPPANG